MSTTSLLRVVLDTNIVFEGLTKQSSAAGLIIELWRTNLLNICVSDALWYEYEDVLTRHLSTQRWYRIQPVLNALILQAEFTTIYYTWRPSSPDPGDEHVIDCAMNANAILVTANLRDFREAQQSLGVRVIHPTALVGLLTD